MTVLIMLLAALTTGPSADVAAVAPVPVTSNAKPACGPAPWRAAAPIMRLIDRSGFKKLGRPKLDALRHSDIQKLREEDVYRALDKFYAGSLWDQPGWRRAYFKTGGYYMASMYYVGKGGRDVRRGHVAIFSGKLRLVHLYANL